MYNAMIAFAGAKEREHKRPRIENMNNDELRDSIFHINNLLEDKMWIAQPTELKILIGRINKLLGPTIGLIMKMLDVKHAAMLFMIITCSEELSQQINASYDEKNIEFVQEINASYFNKNIELLHDEIKIQDHITYSDNILRTFLRYNQDWTNIYDGDESYFGVNRTDRMTKYIRIFHDVQTLLMYDLVDVTGDDDSKNTMVNYFLRRNFININSNNRYIQHPLSTLVDNGEQDDRQFLYRVLKLSDTEPRNFLLTYNGANINFRQGESLSILSRSLFDHEFDDQSFTRLIRINALDVNAPYDLQTNKSNLWKFCEDRLECPVHKPDYDICFEKVRLLLSRTDLNVNYTWNEHGTVIHYICTHVPELFSSDMRMAQRWKREKIITEWTNDRWQRGLAIDAKIPCWTLLEQTDMILKELLNRHDLVPDTTRADGRTPLFLAIKSLREDSEDCMEEWALSMIKPLIMAGADPSLLPLHHTPLHFLPIITKWREDYLREYAPTIPVIP